MSELMRNHSGHGGGLSSQTIQAQIVDEVHIRHGNRIKLCVQDKRVKMHVRVQANRLGLKWNSKQKLELSCSIRSPIRRHSAYERNQLELYE